MAMGQFDDVTENAHRTNGLHKVYPLDDTALPIITAEKQTLTVTHVQDSVRCHLLVGPYDRWYCRLNDAIVSLSCQDLHAPRHVALQ